MVSGQDSHGRDRGGAKRGAKGPGEAEREQEGQQVVRRGGEWPGGAARNQEGR